MALAGLFVAPSFIDWTPYRETFARQLSSAVGRPVSIEGAVAFALVPRPALEAGVVRVGTGVDVVTIEEVNARLAVLPLLKGDLHFQDLRLDDAVGAIALDLPWSQLREDAPAIASPAPVTQAITVNVDRVEFNGGDLTLRDRSGADLLRIQNMDIAFAAKGRDHFELEGDLRLNGQPMSLGVTLGAQGGDGVRTVSMSARIPAAEATVSASGRISLTKRTFDGDVNINAERGAALLSELGFPVGSSPALARQFQLSAKTSADETGVAFRGVTLNAGGLAGQGAVEWRRARTPQLTVSLDFAPFALDDWYPSSNTAAIAKATAPTAAPASAPAQPREPTVSSLTAEIALRFPALTARNQSLRDGNVKASLANGELKISDLSATLPGTTRFNAFGLVSFAHPTPVIDGVVSLQTFDARGLASWLGADVSDVPSGRLSSASLQAAVQGSFSFLELNDIEGALDTARIGGRLSYAPRARPFFGVDLRLENINFDSYRGASAVTVAPAKGTPPPPPVPAPSPGVYGVTATGAALSELGAFDAEVRVEATDVTAGGLPGGRVGLDLGLKDGKLDVRTASFEKIAGTTGWFSGAVAGFGTALQFNNLQFDLAGDDIARLAKLVGVDLAPALNALGPTSLIGTINGGAVQADVAATLKAAGLTARATGQMMNLDKAPRFNGQIDAAHPRFSELMRATAISWPANMRDPGAFAIKARIAQDGDRTVITEARANVGKDKVTATAEISRRDGKLRVTASLSDILIDLDRILPSDAAPVARTPLAGATSTAPAAPASLWSQDTIAWSFLKDWTGEIAAEGSAFGGRGVQLQDFSVRILVEDGAAELADWDGNIFGAPGQLGLRISAIPEPSVQGQIAVKGADFRALIAALNGGRTSLKSSGTADVTASFGARGTSAAGFAGTFAGAGALTVSASETGTGLSAGLLGPLNAAAQLDVGTPGKPAPITFSVRLAAEGGTVKLENAQISSRSHTGSFTGVINLPRRQVDVSGTLVSRKSGEDRLPISINGAMDRPTIRLLPPG